MTQTSWNFTFHDSSATAGILTHRENSHDHNQRALILSKRKTDRSRELGMHLSHLWKRAMR